VATDGTRDDAQASGHRDQDQAKPLYEIIRDELIADIDSGKYPVGALLPSIRDMSVRWTVSTTTARRVLSELVNAGYARPEGTRGHMAIRPAPETKPQVEAPQAPAGQQPPMPVPMVRTAQVITTQGAVDAPTSRIDVRGEPAPPDVAMALELAESSAPVLVRRRVTTDAEGSPIQFRVSYISPGISPENTPLASHDAIDGPWHEVLATHMGRAIKVAESYICARHPTDTEAAMLALAPSACVLVRVDRTQDGNGKPVDYTVTVWPGDSTRIQNPSN
jgi:DNA-binding GntR family transcriptional regulator